MSTSRIAQMWNLHHSSPYLLFGSPDGRMDAMVDISVRCSDPNIVCQTRVLVSERCCHKLVNTAVITRWISQLFCNCSHFSPNSQLLFVLLRTLKMLIMDPFRLLLPSLFPVFASRYRGSLRIFIWKCQEVPVQTSRCFLWWFLRTYHLLLKYSIQYRVNTHRAMPEGEVYFQLIKLFTQTGINQIRWRFDVWNLSSSLLSSVMRFHRQIGPNVPFFSVIRRQRDIFHCQL